MGPKSFTACYICLKEFGSKSIALHEPLCLKRWRASNKKLPADKRSSTPVKNTDKNQNNPSWVCSHCRFTNDDAVDKPSAKRKSSSPKRVRSDCTKLGRSECCDVCTKSSSPKQLRSDCTKLVKCGDECSTKSTSPKQLRSDCTKQPKCGDECITKSTSPKQLRSDCTKLGKSECGDECTKSTSPKQLRSDCTKQPKCGDECIKSTSPKQLRSDNTKLVKCGDVCTKSTSPKQPRSDCTKLGKSSHERTKSSSPKRVLSHRTKLGKSECSEDCTKSTSPKQLRSDCTKLGKCRDECTKSSGSIKHSDSADKLKGISSPKQQSKSNIPKQVSSDSGANMTGLGKPEFSPKKGKENKNNSNQIPPPIVARKNAKNEAKSDPKLEPIVKEGPEGEEPPEISSTSRRSVRPQTKILRRPTPNLNHPVIQQVDSDDSSGDSSCSDKSKDDNPKRPRMGEDAKPKNFIIYNKNNVDRKQPQKSNTSKERNSATLQSAIPNPCNSCNRSLAPERLHSHAKKDARGLMYRKSPPLLDVKMTSPQKKLANNISKLPKPVPLTPDSDDSNSTKMSRSDTLLQVPSEDTSKSEPEDTQLSSSSSAEEDKELEKACYICLKEFKVSSLLLHESKCLESWKKTNNSLTPNLRKLPPRRPDEDTEDPVWTSVQSQLVPCLSCGRTFFPERLPVHRRVCKGKPSPRALKRTSSLREHSASSSEGDGLRPAAVYVACYVCGRNYGSWVISMHEQQCIRRWRGENQELPDEEQKEEPAKPERQEDEDVTSLVELGDNAWESHLQELVPCPLCTRTFFPDRLGVHKRSCKGPTTGARRPKSNKGA